MSKLNLTQSYGAMMVLADFLEQVRFLQFQAVNRFNYDRGVCRV